MSIYAVIYGPNIFYVIAPLSGFHCRNQPVSSTVISNVMLSTVLACEGRKCSLQLKIATSVNATGVYYSGHIV